MLAASQGAEDWAHSSVACAQMVFQHLHFPGPPRPPRPCRGTLSTSYADLGLVHTQTPSSPKWARHLVPANIQSPFQPSRRAAWNLSASAPDSLDREPVQSTMLAGRLSCCHAARCESSPKDVARRTLGLSFGLHGKGAATDPAPASTLVPLPWSCQWAAELPRWLKVWQKDSGSCTATSAVQQEKDARL